MGTGRPPGNYNPKGPHGWFGKGKQYTDSVVDENFKLRESQIAAYERSRQVLNSENPYEPLDMRGKVADKWYTEKATKRAQEYYDLMKKELENTEIDPEINLMDKDSVSRFSYDFVKNQQSLAGFKGKPLCHDIAGATAAILDHYGISYECHNGFCSGNPDDSKNIPFTNHTWIYVPELGLVYEYFEGQSIVYHHNISSDIVFKK